MRHWRRKQRAGLDADFRDWALARQAHLRRSAYVLCGDWHLAEDLTQTTLAKLYAVWHRVDGQRSRDAYARRVLYRTFVDETRRSRRREHPGEDLPEVAAPAVDSELRMTLLEAVGSLPPRSRAVIVLRFWEDLSVQDTASALGCTTGTVKSQTSRALAALKRHLMADDSAGGCGSPAAGATSTARATPRTRPVPGARAGRE